MTATNGYRESEKTSHSQGRFSSTTAEIRGSKQSRSDQRQPTIEKELFGNVVNEYGSWNWCRWY